MSLDLFTDVVGEDRQHPIYRTLKNPRFEPERRLLREWSEGFVDRDGKFVQEFQISFESCLWELYLNACFRQFGIPTDFSYPAPDFLVGEASGAVCVEATVAQPAQGAPAAFGYPADAIPEDFNEFNADATLRICNSFSSKLAKYRASYRSLPHVKDRPYVIAIGAYDRPFAHLAANRPILGALYGLYFDEEATIATQAPNVVRYPVSAVRKSELASVALGLFADDACQEVSAVIYSCLATWGKVRALAENPSESIVFTAVRPSPAGIRPLIEAKANVEYKEDLLDGLYVFENPYASKPLPPGMFSSPRVARMLVRDDGDLELTNPDDFLLVRWLMSGGPK